MKCIQIESKALIDFNRNVRYHYTLLDVLFQSFNTHSVLIKVHQNQLQRNATHAYIYFFFTFFSH